jgi:hypothetical protein
VTNITTGLAATVSGRPGARGDELGNWTTRELKPNDREDGLSSRSLPLPLRHARRSLSLRIPLRRGWPDRTVTRLGAWRRIQCAELSCQADRIGYARLTWPAQQRGREGVLIPVYGAAKSSVAEAIGVALGQSCPIRCHRLDWLMCFAVRGVAPGELRRVFLANLTSVVAD